MRRFVAAAAVFALLVLAGCHGSGDHAGGSPPTANVSTPKPMGKTVQYTADGSTVTVDKFKPAGFDSAHPEHAAVHVKFCLAKSEKGSAQPGDYGWVIRSKDGTTSREAASPPPDKPGKLLPGGSIARGSCEQGWVVIALKGSSPAKFVQIDSAAGLVQWKLPNS